MSIIELNKILFTLTISYEFPIYQAARLQTISHKKKRALETHYVMCNDHTKLKLKQRIKFN